MAEFKFENGDKVKDVITTYKGVVTGNVDYITGCKQCLISPKNGDEAKWIDEDRLKLLKKGEITLDIENPGFDLQAPVK